MKRRMVTLVMTLLAVGGIFSSATPSGAATTSQLKTKLLSLSDMPAGWTVDHSGSGDIAASGCLKSLHSSPPKGVRRVSAAFTDGQFPAMNETVETGTGSVGHFHQAIKDLADCKGGTLRSDGQQVHVSIVALSFPKVGSESSAFSVTIADQGFSVGGDYIIFRTGRYVASIAYANSGTPSVGAVELFVQKALAKIQGNSVTVT